MAAQALLYGGMAGLQLASSYFAAQNVREQAQLNRDIAEMNAEFAELDAYDARIDGISQQAQYQATVDKTLAEQQLALTAADVDVSYGSASTIAKETEFVAELNKMEIQKQAEMRALGFEQQARQYSLSGYLQQLQGDIQASNIQTQGLANAAGTGISGYQRMK